jgi:hypothetical protein
MNIAYTPRKRRRARGRALPETEIAVSYAHLPFGYLLYKNLELLYMLYIGGWYTKSPERVERESAEAYLIRGFCFLVCRRLRCWTGPWNLASVAPERGGTILTITPNIAITSSRLKSSGSCSSILYLILSRKWDFHLSSDFEMSNWRGAILFWNCWILAIHKPRNVAMLGQWKLRKLGII